MKNTIYILALTAILGWSSSVFAQEMPEESANAGVSESVPVETPPAEEANGADLTPSEGQASEATVPNDAVPSTATKSYLITDDPIETDLPQAEANVPLDEPQSQADQPDAMAQNDGLPVADEAPLQAEEDTAQPVDSDNQDETGWRSGIGFLGGIGPAFDLQDSAAGYSARLGLDLHWKYLGLGIEVTWNTLWATVDTKRAAHRNVSYRTTNSGILLIAHGYIPTTDTFVITLGAGVGLGQRYEKIFSNEEIEEEDSSWLARLETGGLWLFDNNLTLGLAIELNFGGYPDPREVWWSDRKDDISLGLVVTISYQLMK